MNPLSKDGANYPLDFGHPVTPSLQYQQNDLHLMNFEDGSSAIGNLSVPRRRQHFDPVDFDQNLVEFLPENELREFGMALKKGILEDIESQKPFINATTDCLQLTGLDLAVDLGVDDLPFEGATDVNSMAMFNTFLDFLAMICSSLFPASGMADTVINGESTDELEDLAFRQKAFNNYFLDNVAKEFRKEARRAVSWSIMTGNCYKKIFIDPILRRPVSMHIRPGDFIVHKDWATHLIADRKTQLISMTRDDLRDRIRMGIYQDVTVSKSDLTDLDRGEMQEQLNVMQGKENTYSEPNEDNVILFETHILERIPGDLLVQEIPHALPYRVTLDSKTGNILSIHRNWKIDDPERKPRQFFVNYSLIPAFEGEGYGLIHYAARLSKAATQMTRQLINTATYANFAGGLYASGLRLENNNLRPNPGEWVAVQTGGVPIDQAFMSLPYKEPGPTMKELLVDVKNEIKAPALIINEEMVHATTRAPQGSVLWMFENMLKVPNLILETYHEAFSQELMILNERFAEWLPPGQPYPFKVPGAETAIMKEDFSQNIVVVPSSNPSVQNSSYRFIRSEIILNNARQAPEIHDMHYAYQYFYKHMGLTPEDIQKLLPSPDQKPPFSGDPATENTLIMQGKPVMANITQDDDAHMMVHSLILNDPEQAQNPQVLGIVNAHMQEHKANKFIKDMQARMGQQLPENIQELPPELQNQFAIQEAQIANQKLQEMQAQNPPPMDPIKAEIHIEEMRLQQKREADQAKYQIEQMQLDFERYKLQTQMQIEQMKMDAEKKHDAVKLELENKKIHLDHLNKENTHQRNLVHQSTENDRKEQLQRQKEQQQP